MANNSNTMEGVLLDNEPLARYTSWRVGGVAEYFYKPSGIAELPRWSSEQ